MKKILAIMVLAVSCLCFAAEPIPILTNPDREALNEWAETKPDVREFAAAFGIKFPAIFGSKTAHFGLFKCYVDDNGFLAVAITPKRTEMLKPLVLTSKIKVKSGTWYHVEFSCSMNSRRAALYIDGHFQMENDQLLIPAPEALPIPVDAEFGGEVRDLKIYNAALFSEELAYADSADYADWQKRAAAVAALQKNQHLTAWAKELANRFEKADRTTISIAAYKRWKNAIENTEKLAAEKDLKNEPVKMIVTPATSQALYLPYDLPASLGNSVELVMAKDEYESASVIAYPLVPVKNFTIRMTQLRDGNNVLPPPDIKLVKRWYRTGGAWMSYHTDLYARLLTPDMLLNSDKLVKVDEFRRTNQVLMNYPTGAKYQDVSDFGYDRQWLDGGLEHYFTDAPTLQPLDLTESGRNQQFIITCHAPENAAPGIYSALLELLADGKKIGDVPVRIRVLPFALPQPAAYDDLSKTYLSHVNSHDGHEKNLINAKKHNLMHLSRVASSPEMIQQAIRNGYPLEIIFDMVVRRYNLGNMIFDGPASAWTPEVDKQLERIALLPYLRFQKMLKKYGNLDPEDYIIYRCQTSETSHYGAINLHPDRLSNVLREKTSVRLFSHGMSDALPTFSPGVYEMDSAASHISADVSRIWHSFGGRSITYAFPFPGPENPGLMRRAVGLELYHTQRADGHMMHGYVENQLNEFTKYPGGDGDYRTFCLAYNSGDSCINRIAIIGCREGYDDVRYATLLKRQALAALKSKHVLIVREATRQLVWLERIDGRKLDMDAFRIGAQYRIISLMNLINQLEGGAK